MVWDGDTQGSESTQIIPARITGSQFVHSRSAGAQDRGGHISHIEHQILESRERTLSSPAPPSPTNLPTEGGSRPEKRCKILSESFAWHKQWWQMMLWGGGDKTRSFILSKPEVWGTILKPGFCANEAQSQENLKDNTPC